jgi:hypothetical protein
MSSGLADISAADYLGRKLGTQGYLLLHEADFAATVTASDLEAFGAEWEDMPPDTELVDGGRYRHRRYGRLQVDTGPDGLRFAALPHASFQQDAEHIPLYGGRARTFAPIPERVLLHPAMRAIVSVDLDVVQRVAADVPSWVIGLHMVRIVAEPGSLGKPTPEGRHRDGHRYVGMHMMRRTNCQGGQSLIYANGGAVPDVELTLLTPLDTLIVDDTAIEHEVTPIDGLGITGVRDMLLVDMNPR